jgi:hypothetical protein
LKCPCVISRLLGDCSAGGVFLFCFVQGMKCGAQALAAELTRMRRDATEGIENQAS